MGRFNDRDFSSHEVDDLLNQLSRFVLSEAPKPIKESKSINDSKRTDFNWDEERRLFATIKRRQDKLVLYLKVDILDFNDVEDVQDMIKRAFAIRERTNP